MNLSRTGEAFFIFVGRLFRIPLPSESFWRFRFSLLGFTKGSIQAGSLPEQLTPVTSQTWIQATGSFSLSSHRRLGNIRVKLILSHLGFLHSVIFFPPHTYSHLIFMCVTKVSSFCPFPPSPCISSHMILGTCPDLKLWCLFHHSFAPVYTVTKWEDWGGAKRNMNSGVYRIEGRLLDFLGTQNDFQNLLWSVPRLVCYDKRIYWFLQRSRCLL